MVANTAWSLFKFRRKLIEYLVDSKYEVILAAPYDEFVPRLEKLGARFIPLQYLSAKGINPFKDVFLIKELVVLYRSLKPGLVFHYTIKPNVYGSIAASISRISSISVVTGLGYTFINNNWISRIGRMIYRLAMKYSTETWFLNSDDMEIFLSRKITTLQKARLLSTGEGIDVDGEFNPSQHVVSKWPGVNFILVGRLLYDKGVIEYIEAAKSILRKYNNVHFHLLGYINVENPSAISKDTVNAWVQEGIVTYHGSVDDVREFVLSSSCVVLPSYREGMSTILMESAALGLPLIATNIPGCKELIDDNVTGFLCHVKDAADLSEKMELFIKLDLSDKEKMGVQGRMKIQREFGVQQVFELYSQAINRYIRNR